MAKTSGWHLATLDSAAVAAITAPHLLYAFIWFLPEVWRTLFPKPIRAFQLSASILKVVQVLTLFEWYSVKSQTEGLKLDLLKVPIGQWGAFFLLVFLGQVLNIAVYRLLGERGVYYGSRLGKKVLARLMSLSYGSTPAQRIIQQKCLEVAWQKGFPFNVVSHPQYVGAVLTIAGLLALVWGQAPRGAVTLLGYWASLYGITAIQEQFL